MSVYKIIYANTIYATMIDDVNESLLHMEDHHQTQVWMPSLPVLVSSIVVEQEVHVWKYSGLSLSSVDHHEELA